MKKMAGEGDRQRQEKRIQRQKELNEKKRRRKIKVIPKKAPLVMSVLILNKIPQTIKLDLGRRNSWS